MTNKDVIEEAKKEEVRGLAGRGIAKLIRDLATCKYCKYWVSRANVKPICILYSMHVSDPDFFCASGEQID